jgi:hypothetical protein
MSRFVEASLSLEAAWPALCRWWWMLVGLELASREPLLASVFQSGPAEAARGFDGGKRALAAWLRRRLNDDFRGSWSGPGLQRHQHAGESHDDK